MHDVLVINSYGKMTEVLRDAGKRWIAPRPLSFTFKEILYTKKVETGLKGTLYDRPNYTCQKFSNDLTILRA
jgi:hypothetical protein